MTTSDATAMDLLNKRCLLPAAALLTVIVPVCFPAAFKPMVILWVLTAVVIVSRHVILRSERRAPRTPLPDIPVGPPVVRLPVETPTVVKPAAMTFPLRAAQRRPVPPPFNADLPSDLLVMAPRPPWRFATQRLGRQARLRMHREWLAYRLHSPWMLTADGHALGVFLFGLWLWDRLRANNDRASDLSLGHLPDSPFVDLLYDEGTLDELESRMLLLETVLGSSAAAFVATRDEGLCGLADAPADHVMQWAGQWADPATASLPAHAWWQAASAAGLGGLLLDEALSEYGAVDPDTPTGVGLRAQFSPDELERRGIRLEESEDTLFGSDPIAGELAGLFEHASPASDNPSHDGIFSDVDAYDSADLPNDGSDIDGWDVGAYDGSGWDAGDVGGWDGGGWSGAGD